MEMRHDLLLMVGMSQIRIRTVLRGEEERHYGPRHPERADSSDTSSTLYWGRCFDMVKTQRYS